MASLNLSVKVKTTESFMVLMDIREEIEVLLDLVPEFYPEKEIIADRLKMKFRRFAELVEIEPE